MKRKLLAILLSLFVCLCFVLASCVDDGDGNSTGTTAPVTSTTQGGGVDSTSGTANSTNNEVNDNPRLAVYESYVAFMNSNDDTPLSYEEWLETIKGADGETPHIGENGNWHIGSLDMGVPATGVQGEKGDKGDSGVGVEKIEIVDGELIICYTNGTKANLGKFAVDRNCTVTFDTGCGALIPDQVVEFGGRAKRPDELVRPGYIFNGWYCQGELWSFVGYSVVEDIVLEASWSPITYTATFVANGTIVGTREFLTDDTIVPFDVPKKEGYVGAWESYSLNNENITINAVYTPIVYEAMFVIDSAIVARVNFTVEDTYLTLPTLPTREGYVGHWSHYTIQASDIVVFAVWEEIKIKDTVIFISFKIGSGKIESGEATVTLKSGEALTGVPVVVREGYTFKGWSYSATNREFWSEGDLFFDDTNLYAIWEKDPS